MTELRAPLLTYCTNIHPGEAWADVLRNLEEHLLAVKAQVSPDTPFPVGIRLSNRAANELDPRESGRFRDWCERHDCFVLTVNGFPYGQFHGGVVKEKVYSPDWRDPARGAYTKRLADLLADWLPVGVEGSISTAPIAFKPLFDPADWPPVRRNLMDVLEHLDRIHQDRGVKIVLALEPEPCCVLETMPEVVALFERMSFPQSLSDLVGVCFDCCHQAVEFEEPAASLQLLAEAGIPIGKVQVSSSLRARGEEIGQLEGFAEPTYLHQVVARAGDGTLRRYTDLPHFAQEKAEPPDECRVHFHVPVFADHLGHCGTTRFFLEDILPRLDPVIPLEIETYSWDVLPGELRQGPVAKSIVRELEWVKETIDATDRGH